MRYGVNVLDTNARFTEFKRCSSKVVIAFGSQNVSGLVIDLMARFHVLLKYVKTRAMLWVEMKTRAMLRITPWDSTAIQLFEANSLSFRSFDPATYCQRS